ncbi:MAG: holo-ACP synthase [Gorillibacterium sp.]|nr:holo-ACP synthase [Gorillibacterium sp.]
MIIGIGTDMTEIDRVEHILLGKAAGRFLKRVLTDAELTFLEERGGKAAEYVAGRFAAKEAVAKAFGTGIGSMISFGDIEVMADSAGRPVCTVSLPALLRLGIVPGTIHIHVSVTHTRITAGAFAVVEQC